MTHTQKIHNLVKKGRVNPVSCDWIPEVGVEEIWEQREPST